METRSEKRKSSDNISEEMIENKRSATNDLEVTLPEEAPIPSTSASVDLAAKKEPEDNAALAEQKLERSMSDLNDDCCLEILKHLNILDLATVTEVNKMFKRCAERTFQTVHMATLDFSDPRIAFDESNFKRVLNKFGASTVNLNVSFELHPFRDMTGMNVINLIAKSCGTNMRKLQINYLQIDLEECDQNEIKLISRLVSNLKELILKGTLDNGSVIFDSCRATIERLDFVSFNTLDDATSSSLQRNFPNLQSLIWTTSNGQESFLVNLLSLNSAIRTLKLNLYALPRQILDAIVHLPELSYLRVQHLYYENVININAISKIKKLTRLELTYFTSPPVHSLIKSLAGNETLTHMELYIYDTGIKDNYVNDISKIPTLQVLKVHNVSSNYIYGRFDNLVEFHVMYFERINDKVLLPQIVKMMPRLRELHVTNPSSRLNLTVVQQVSQLRSNESKLIIFWDVHGALVEVKSVDNIIAVYETRIQTHYSFQFNYKLTQNDQDFATTCKRLLDISRKKQIVKVRFQNC